MRAEWVVALAIVAGAQGAGGLPLVGPHLTLAGPGAITEGDEAGYGGTLSAAGVGLPDQPVEVRVDGAAAATVPTDGAGAYLAGLALGSAGTHTVQAFYRSGTPVEASSPLLTVTVAPADRLTLGFTGGSFSCSQDGGCTSVYTLAGTLVHGGGPLGGADVLGTATGWLSCGPDDVCGGPATTPFGAVTDAGGAYEATVAFFFPVAPEGVCVSPGATAEADYGDLTAEAVSEPGC